MTLTTNTPTQTITTEIVNVTPAMARDWLLTNKRNRTISKGAVDKYKRDMEAGNWAFAADPIRFDTEGNLLDGQHRLTAISLLDGGHFPLLVIRGLAAESQLVMDQGVKRAAGAQLDLLGIKYAHKIASGVRLYIGWQEGGVYGRHRSNVTTADIESWVSGNPELVRTLQDMMPVFSNIDAPDAVKIPAFLSFYKIDPPAAVRFFDALSTGAGLEANDPILMLMNRQRKIRLTGVKTTVQDMLGLFILTWNAWHEGRTIGVLRRPISGWDNENFPEPR